MTALRQRNKVLEVLGHAKTNFTISAIKKPTIGKFQFKPLNGWCKDYENSPREVIAQLNGKVRTFVTSARLKAYGINLSNLFGDCTVDKFLSRPKLIQASNLDHSCQFEHAREDWQ
jgi:hypothetical protein